MNDRTARAACIAVLVALSALIYAPNLTDYFQGDDFDLIHSFFDKPAGYFVGLLVNDESGSVWDYLCHEPGSLCPDPENHGFLRPFKMWLLKLDFELWGTAPFGYHLTSSTVFVANVVLVFLILEQLLKRKRALAFLGAATVAVHPIFAGVVPSITYREEIIASALALGCVLRFLMHRRQAAPAWGAHAFYALALLTKESAIVTVGFLAGYDLLDWFARGATRAGLRKRLIYYLPVVGILAVYFGLRLIAFKNLVGGHGETDFRSLEGLLGFHTTLFDYLFRAPMLSFSGVPLIQPLSVLMVLGLLAVVFWRREKLDRDYFVRLGFAGPIWYVASTALAHGIYFSPRHVLTTVIGLVLFGVVLLEGVTVIADVKRDWMPAAVLVLALAALLPPTRTMSLRFSEASRMVHATLQDIERETAQLEDGSRVLIQNLPELSQFPPPFFANGLDSALKRPFSKTDLARRLRVETRNSGGNYDLVLRF